jgi:hypothetical protein
MCTAHTVVRAKVLFNGHQQHIQSLSRLLISCRPFTPPSGCRWRASTGVGSSSSRRIVKQSAWGIQSVMARQRVGAMLQQLGTTDNDDPANEVPLSEQTFRPMEATRQRRTPVDGSSKDKDEYELVCDDDDVVPELQMRRGEGWGAPLTLLDDDFDEMLTGSVTRTARPTTMTAMDTATATATPTASAASPSTPSDPRAQRRRTYPTPTPSPVLVSAPAEGRADTITATSSRGLSGHLLPSTGKITVIAARSEGMMPFPNLFHCERKCITVCNVTVRPSSL